MRVGFPLLTLLLTLSACTGDPAPNPPTLTDAPSHIRANRAVPEWAKGAVIYEVNIRQYTPEGTLNAFAEHLPRLADLGVDILWLMPIYPISEAKRKGTLGSYYAVSDFEAVNPEFGTKEDFGKLVERAHELGMKVILDFVPNHTGWDHKWLTENKDYYTQDADGNVVDPQDPETGESYGWTDVADLNYDNPEMRRALTDNLLYWIENYDIDGYRMDIAFGAPDDYWAEATKELRELKPDIFLLAESEEKTHRNENYFAANYGWSFHHLMNAVAKGDTTAAAIRDWHAQNVRDYDRGFHMQFITNHDENSWNGTVAERMGENARPMAVLSFTLEGMPLIYSGQEAGLNKRLKFFEKDEIAFSDTSQYGFYRTLAKLKEDNAALHNGSYGGEAVFHSNLGNDPETSIAYSRTQGGQSVLVLLNFGDELANFRLPADSQLVGEWLDVFAGARRTLAGGQSVQVSGHGYVVLSSQLQAR